MLEVHFTPRYPDCSQSFSNCVRCWSKSQWEMSFMLPWYSWWRVQTAAEGYVEQ